MVMALAHERPTGVYVKVGGKEICVDDRLILDGVHYGVAVYVVMLTLEESAIGENWPLRIKGRVLPEDTSIMVKTQ